MARDGIPKNKKDNSKRKFRGPGPRPDRAEFKRSEDARREGEWRKLSPKQQLEALDLRLGKGLGAKKQRARLAQKIATTNTKGDAPRRNSK